MRRLIMLAVTSLLVGNTAIAGQYEVPSMPLQTVVASRLHAAYKDGIVGVAGAVQKCYAAARSQDAVKECLLMDGAAFQLDSSVSAQLRVQPYFYFSGNVFNSRMDHYAGPIFGGLNDAAKAYLMQPSVTISKMVAALPPKK